MKQSNKSTYRFLYLLASVASACMMQNVHAADYVYNGTIDLSLYPVQVNGPGVEPYQSDTFGLSGSTFPTFTFNVGDTISGTIKFKNNETLTLSGAGTYLTQFGFETAGSSNGTTFSNVSTLLTGLKGNLTTSNPTVTIGEDNQDGSGNALLDTTLLRTNSSFSFTGFQYSYTLTSISGKQDGFVPTSFYVSSLASPDAIVISVPEPSTNALMLGGLTVLAFCLRRKGLSIK